MQSRLWPADSELCPVYIGARAQQRAKGFARAARRAIAFWRGGQLAPSSTVSDRPRPAVSCERDDLLCAGPTKHGRPTTPCKGLACRGDLSKTGAQGLTSGEAKPGRRAPTGKLR
jgi:hypothetical protein